MVNRVQPYSIKTDGFSGKDIEVIAQIHRKEIGTGFLASFGLEPVRLLYSALANSRNCLVVAGLQEDTKLVGFIAGTVDYPAFCGDFLRTKGLAALKVVLPRLFCRTGLRSAIEAMTFAVWRRRSGLPRAQVLNFAVQPDYQGSGLATSLFSEMMRQFWRRGVREVVILSGEEQERAHRFYQKMGAYRVGSTTAHQGRKDLIFLFRNKDRTTERMRAEGGLPGNLRKLQIE